MVSPQWLAERSDLASRDQFFKTSQNFGDEIILKNNKRPKCVEGKALG
jgi:hypothetical protein